MLARLPTQRHQIDIHHQFTGRAYRSTYLLYNGEHKMCKVFFSLAVAFIATSISVAAQGDTLVLLDNLAIKETHSIFFKSIQGM